MNRRGEALPAVLLTVAVVAVLLSTFVGWPLWRVWQRELAGKAQLQEATWSRRIAVEEAQAKMDAAALLAQAEVARARGLAEANTIVIQSLGSPDAYLRYLWIDQIQDNQVFYVPTEATLPILEAGRAIQPN
jgi:hypothetical protein